MISSTAAIRTTARRVFQCFGSACGFIRTAFFDAFPVFGLTPDTMETASAQRSTRNTAYTVQLSIKSLDGLKNLITLLCAVDSEQSGLQSVVEVLTEPLVNLS